MIMGYIDPGSGSILLQLIAGGIIGGLFIIKQYWRKLIALPARLKQRKAAAKQ